MKWDGCAVDDTNKREPERCTMYLQHLVRDPSRKIKIKKVTELPDMGHSAQREDVTRGTGTESCRGRGRKETPTSSHLFQQRAIPGPHLYCQNYVLNASNETFIK